MEGEGGGRGEREKLMKGGEGRGQNVKKGGDKKGRRSWGD